jgi:hypothetical protein
VPERSSGVEEVDKRETPRRARATIPDAETATEKLERKRDYLEGFLAAKPEGVAPGEPGGDLYEGVIARSRKSSIRKSRSTSTTLA